MLHWWRRSVYPQIFVHQLKSQPIALLLQIVQQFIYMRFFLFFAIIVAIAVSCSPAYKFNKDKPAFEASSITHSFKSIADMNDSYFEIRENNFFEFYRQLFDSVKNTSYPGKYELKNDTMYLNFYDKRGKTLLGSKAVIKESKNEIVFFK